MTEITLNGYTLLQIAYSKVTHVIYPDGTERRVVGPRLTQDNARSIILSAGKSSNG